MTKISGPDNFRRTKTFLQERLNTCALEICFNCSHSGSKIICDRLYHVSCRDFVPLWQLQINRNQRSRIFASRLWGYLIFSLLMHAFYSSTSSMFRPLFSRTYQLTSSSLNQLEQILANQTKPTISTSLGSSTKSKLHFTGWLRGMASSSVSGPTGKHLVAVCQLNCVDDKDSNYKSASILVNEAAATGARMIFLPECFDFIGNTKQESIEAAEPLDGPTLTRYRDLARSMKVWLSLGGMHRKNTDPNVKKILNAHIILDDKGDIRSIYHKTHLFNLEIPNVVRLIEGESYVAGDRLPQPIETPIGKVGLGICYDLRFGEMAMAYAKAGADVLTYPSSFTVPTGIHHWEPLLRSRAIENQCYVVAAAQVGTHNPKRSSFGHAMIVDPWGTKIAECGDGVGFAVALIDHTFKEKCRSRLPIWTDRRTDLYADIEPAIDNYAIEDVAEYKFQDMTIPHSQVFYRSRYSYAFVNHRPVLNGHMLVSPLRVCKKYKELSPAEVTDLMLLVQRVERTLERIYETDSTTITIQDGIDAGQSVFHVHVHLLPRKPTDFGGNIDKIYRELQRHDKQEFKKEYRKLSEAEMSEISKKLRENM